ncbi:hypothetical protein [Kordia sp.]|uniref:hypothetical protein n=1 Tax=Kordia sp. TaxID=1965332 RepID=UPI0025B8B9DC|nr:hypothetical protein [Kordia sp.]MCH2195486.1 hypothetical protein [Kordia sp.]
MKTRSLGKLKLKKVNVFNLYLSKGGIPKAITQGRSEACLAPRASEYYTYELMCASPALRAY